MILAILAGLYHFDLGIVRAVVGSWADVLGSSAEMGTFPSPLLDDGVCFAVLVLVILVASWVMPLEDACSRLMARIKASASTSTLPPQSASPCSVYPRGMLPTMTPAP